VVIENILIMAAGLGTRMKSRRAKVLHLLAGRPLISYVYRTAMALEPSSILIIVGHQAEEVEAIVNRDLEIIAASGRSAPSVKFILQAEQRGTGHAVMQAAPELRGKEGTLMVLSGDVPLVRVEDLLSLISFHKKNGFSATAMTTMLDDPRGYGRILRDSQGQFLRIVEQRDATEEQNRIKEINAGIYCFEIEHLLPALDKLTTANAQGEYYLTDVLEIMKKGGHSVGLLCHERAEEVLGINTRMELATAERLLRQRKLNELMLNGVTIIDPDSTYISPEVEIGADTVIYPQVIIEGRSQIGNDCTIHSWSRLTNVRLGNGVTVHNSCVISDSILHQHSTVGPFAHLRMGAELCEGARVGNFVEVKKSRLGRDSKSMHLTYLGDATIGERVNIGAGTITCNYDGKQKHQTFIEDEVRIGSDTMLVAPVRVGRRSVTGAGTVVIKDVPDNSLVVGVPGVVKKRF